MKDKKEWKRVCVCMEPCEYRRLRVEAGVVGVSISELVRQLVRHHLLMDDKRPTAKPS